MALEGFTIGGADTGGSGAAPAAPLPSGGALAGFSIGATPPKTATSTPAAPNASTTPVSSLVASTTPPVATGGLFSKFTGFLSSAATKVSDEFKKVIQNPDASDLPDGGKSGFLNTLAYLPSELARQIPGVAELQDDPTLQSDVANYLKPKDVLPTAAAALPGVLGESAKAFAKMPIAAVSDVYDAGRVFLGKNPNASFNVPGLGNVSSDEFNAAQAVQNGTPAVQAALSSGGSSIFNVLFFADLIGRVAGPRQVKVAETTGNTNDYTSGNGEGARPVVDNSPKSGRLYDPSVANSNAQVLPPEAISRMQSQGMKLGENFNPDQPVFFRLTIGKGGAYTGEMIQVKPSYLRTAYDSVFGTKTPTNTLPALLGAEPSIPQSALSQPEIGGMVDAAPDSVVQVLHSQTVKGSDIVEATKSAIDKAPATQPAALAPKTPAAHPQSTVVAHNALRLLGGDTKKAQEGADILKSEILDTIKQHGPEVAKTALVENVGVDMATAERLVQEASTNADINPHEILQGITGKVIPAPNALTGFTVEGQTPNTLEGVNPKQSTKMSNEEAKPLAEKAATAYWESKIAPAIKSESAIQIGGDDLKEYFGHDYNDNNHAVYSQAAQSLYERALRESKSPDVVFLGGGPGSGKTELVAKQLIRNGYKGILYDSNLSNQEGAQKQIEQAREAGKNVKIYGVLPNLAKARGFTIQREERTGRGITDKTFSRGHTKFPATAEGLLEAGIIPASDVHLLDTRGVEGLDNATAMVARGDFIKDPLAILRTLDYNEEEISQLYAKDTYNKETGISTSGDDQALHQLRVRGGLGEASLQDRTNQGDANGGADESKLGEGGEGKADGWVGYNPHRGFVSLDPLAKAVDATTDYIEQNEKTSSLTKNFTTAIYQHEGARKANRVRAIQLLQNVGDDLTAEQWETLYHHDEDGAVKLTKEEQKTYDEVIAPLKSALTKARAEYRELGGTITQDLREETTPRYAKEKGGPIDVVMNLKKRGEEVIRNGGLLSKSVGSGAKHRVFHTITDANGKHTVVSIKSKKVTAFNDKKPSDLGQFNMTSKESLLRDQLAPIRKRLAALSREMTVLKGVKAGSNGIEAKLRNLEDKALSISVDLMDSSQEKEAQQIAKDKKKVRALIHDIKLLSKVKPAESVILRTERIETLEKKMMEASQEFLNAQDNYDPTELNDRVFVDKNGETYTLGQATTKEIEANTSTSYHKNPLANYVLAYDRTSNALSALKLLDRIKESPESKDLIVKQDPNEAPPEGWRDLTGVLPQFRGYYAEQHLYEALQDLAKRLQGRDTIPVLDEVNNLLTAAIVLNPIMHFPNVAIGWGGATAAINRSPLTSAKSRANFARAVNEVKTKGPLYLHYLEHGAPFMAIKQTAKDFTNAVLTQYSTEVAEKPGEYDGITKALGYANPLAWARGFSNLNEHITWGGNDIMFMHALLDFAEKEGVSPEDAIAGVSKRMSDYRLPSRIGPGKLGRAVSVGMQSRALLFARYHYSGVIKPWIESMKDTAGPGSSAHQRLQGLRVLAYLALMSLIVYPYINKLLRGLTGDPLTYISMAGPTKVVQNVEKLSQTGAVGVPAFAASMFTPSPALMSAIELGFNIDIYTRNPIYGPLPAQGLTDFAVSMVAPLATADRMTPGNFALSLIGIFTPKNAGGKTALLAQKYDELPELEAQIKKDLAAGLTDKATAEMQDFNDRAIANYNENQLALGLKPLADSDLQPFLKEWGVKAPGAVALSNAATLYGNGSLTSKSSLLDRVTTYAEAIGTDPVTAFSRIFTGQVILRVDNAGFLSADSAIIVKRLPLASSEAVRGVRQAQGGESDAAMKGLQLDHFIPLEAGGTNENYNLDLVTTQQNEVLHAAIETPIAAALKNGSISRAKALEFITRYKIGTLGESPTPYYQNLYKNKYGSQPISLADILKAIGDGSAK